MDNRIVARLRSWAATYTLLTVGLFAAFLLLWGSQHRGSIESHTLLEAITTLLGLFAGLVAFIHYYTGHTSRFLFIGSGFVAAAVLDTYHTIATSSWFDSLWPSTAASLTSWSWYPSRLLLAALLLVGWYAWRNEKEQGQEPGWQEWFVFVLVAAMTVVSFLLFFFVRLPEAYWEGGFIGRPFELIPGGFFLLALAGYLRQGNWRSEPFERWIVIFLIISVAIQFLFMSLSRSLFDARFMAAHILKIISYGSILTGLLLNMYRIFMQGEKNTKALERLNQELEQRVANRTKALRDSEERFRALVQGAMDMITILDSQGDILYDSPAVRRVLGYEPEERLGNNAAAYLHPEDVSIVRQKIGEALARPAAPVQVKVRVRHKEGHWRTVEATGTNMTHHSAIGGIVVNWHDITSLQEVAEALDDRNRILNSILDGMNEGVIVAREDGNFIYFNRAAGELLGVGPVETGPEGWTSTYNLCDPETKLPMPTEMLPLVRSLHGETVRSMDLLVRHPDREDGVLLSVSTQPFYDDNGERQGALAVFSDITVERRAEQAIRQMNTELEERVQQRTEQLQAANQELEAFAYSVSHDLRTPLRAMDGFSRILLDDFQEELSPPAQRYLRRIRFNAQQMGALIDDLLTFSRLSRQPLKTEQVQPVQLARQALDSLSSEQEGRQIEITILAMPRVEADARLLRVVFTNLLANAMKYTRAREVARIEVGVLQENGESGSEPVFYVQDNGVGFDMKYVDKIFGVFQRLHRAEEYEGTGVGLATVQRIIHRHRGEVWAKARVDDGATFYFTLGKVE